MILINLLPHELRIKETKKIHVPYRQIAVVIFSVFLLIALYNLFVYVRVREEYRRLDKQWKGLAERNAEAEAMEKELGAAILAEINFYDEFVDPTLEAARVLNLISDFVPNSIWFNQLEFERDKKAIQLTLNGFSSSSGKESNLVEIQKFTNDLKDQMEKFIDPMSSLNPNVKKHNIKVSVTTSSQKSGAEKGEVVQFTANFKSEGFGQK